MESLSYDLGCLELRRHQRKESKRTGDHVLHGTNVAHVPSRNILIEGCPVLGGVLHVRHPRDIPVLNVPVSGGGRGLVGKPEIAGRC